MMKPYTMLAALVAALLILSSAGCAASVGTTTSATSANGTSTSATSTSTSATTTPQATVTADEYAVYSALVQSVYIAKSKQIVITPVHDNDYFFGQAVGAMESNPYWSDLGNAVDDFKAKNRTSSVLERRFTISIPYTIVSEQEMASIFSTNVVSDWKRFYAKYPHVDAFLALSRVGFNQEKDTAVLYTEYQVGAAGGEGYVVLMKKTDGRWTVDQNSMCWIS